MLIIAIFKSLAIIGFAYFLAGIISDNFYTSLYPWIDDYFWAKTIMHAPIYFGVLIIGYFMFIRKYIK
ncbi:hypothetical protein LCGC14_0674670 [marine sediment metagenome]|uniref:Uncharacterized protein n=1 Tax=marine sediment metagenome TaxID=412755 RepID=A0A0F9QQ33_9ZZZZ